MLSLSYISIKMIYFYSCIILVKSSDTTLLLECPSSQLLHCPTARLDKRQAKESTKAPKNLQSVVHMVLDGGKIGDSKTSEFWSLQDFKSETEFLEGPKTCSIFGSSRDPILATDAGRLIAGGKGVSLGAHEGCVLPGGKFFIAMPCQSSLFSLSLVFKHILF